MHVENKIFVINCCKFVIVIYDKIPQTNLLKHIRWVSYLKPKNI